ncbi:TonB-dependent receptor [Sphingobium sp.]|uniref:TonB-dependent receptor n=1 Tax=Sphingobium sp. TaxID=1912891 RepID=UPI0028BF5998|nr:TonB-dependent receptor [Sphingobium sp.]
MKNYRQIIFACQISLGALGIASAASAQETSAAPSADSAGSAVQAQGGVEDIVVVAQRRSERLQEVPIAITALTSKALEVSGVTTTTSLQNSVPGLSMSVQQTSVSPFIRGIGNRNTAPGDESAAALYIDGVYTASLAASVFSLSNIERIEVLKGPQGTLFGRNAAAGVIQVITKNPSTTPSMEASLSYGNYETVVGQFYATTGITDTLAADLSVYGMHQGQGWGRNLATGNEVYKGHEIGIRSKWLLDLGDTTVTLSGDYNRNNPVLDPALRALQGKQLSGGIGYPGFFNVNNTIDVDGTTRQWGGNLQVRHDFGDFQFVSITSHRDVKLILNFDQDGTPANLSTAVFDQYARATTQELQLLAPRDAAFQWIVGAFYFHDNSAYDPLTLTGSTAGGRTIQRFSRQTSTSYAGYAQGTVEIMPQTNLILGARYTSDKRSINGVDAVNGTFGAPVNQHATFSKPTWKVSLDHKFDRDLMVFAQYARGFKSGVFSAPAPTQPAVRPEIIDAFELGFKSELFGRRLRFNASIFYNLFKDVQLQVPVLGSSVLINAARGDVKGLEAELEFVPDRNFRLSASLSYLDGTYTRFPAAPAFTPLPGGGASQVAIDASGNDTIYTPPFTANLNAQYKIPATIGDFDVTGSVYYNDGFFFDPENRARQDNYVLVNASLGWTSANGRWGVKLYGRNLTDAHYYNQIIPQRFGDTAVPDAPRTYGVMVRMNFD